LTKAIGAPWLKPVIPVPDGLLLRLFHHLIDDTLAMAMIPCCSSWSGISSSRERPWQSLDQNPHHVHGPGSGFVGAQHHLEGDGAVPSFPSSCLLSRWSCGILSFSWRCCTAARHMEKGTAPHSTPYRRRHVEVRRAATASRAEVMNADSFGWIDGC
jgi:hypothetical protein